MEKGLIVSCQALENEPLHSSFIMGKMALASYEGGAVGIRANSIEEVKEIKKNVSLPIIGIIKEDYEEALNYCKIVADIRNFLPKEIREDMSRPDAAMYQKIEKYNEEYEEEN